MVCSANQEREWFHSAKRARDATWGALAPRLRGAGQWMLVFFVGSLFLACANNTHDQQLRELTRAVNEVRGQLVKQGNRVEELSQELFVLSETSIAATASTQPTEDVIPARLEIVTLRPEAESSSPLSPDPEDLSELPPVQLTLGPSGRAHASPWSTAASAPAKTKKPAPKRKAKSAPTSARSGHAAAPRSKPRTPQLGAADQAFQAALKAFQAGRAADAQALFRVFVDVYPKHAHVPRALYWLGESLYEGRQYSAAVSEFERVVERYPRSDKAPDALLKVGICMQRLADSGRARQAFQRLITHYPKSALAELARGRLLASAQKVKRP